jgi:hypothetical protein
MTKKIGECGHPERLHVGDVRVHLPWLLGVRRALEDHPDAVDLEFFNGLFEITSGHNQARRAGSHSLGEKTEPPIPPPGALAGSQAAPELSAGMAIEEAQSLLIELGRALVNGGVRASLEYEKFV